MAANVNLKADLKASSEVPPTDSKGTGSVTATYDTASKKLSWKGSISGLSGPATAAHFHSGEVGKNGGVAVPIAGADKGAFEGSATLTDAQAEELMWSKIRESIVGDGKPRVSGHIAYRGVLKREDVPKDLWRPDVVLWAGPRTHFVHYPLRRGELYNLVAVFHSDHYEEGWNAEGSKDVMWQHFKMQVPQVLRMLERIETWRMWVLCDREPVKNWTSGRITLLGDAAHPMLQYLAQGACMATEDAVVLAQKVAASPDDPARAFKAYEQERYLRTGRTQIMARVYGEVYHARGVAAEIRAQALGARTAEESYEGIGWLYGGP